MTGRKILVTGGAGCIGSELCARLAARGEHVIALDNLSSGKVEHVASLDDCPNFRLIVGDLLDPVALDRIVQGSDFVYHLAANPDVRFADEAPDRDHQQNTVATHNLLEAMRRNGVKRIAFSSTSAVYGNQSKQPIAEDQPLRPISLYGATKVACEALIAAHQNLFELQAWVFRFANIVGRKSRSKGRTVVSDFVAKLRDNPHRLEILGDGRQAKSYLAVDECIDAMLFAVERATEPFNLYNLGGDDWLTVRRIAELVVEAMGLRDVEFTFTGTEGGWAGDVPRFRLDVAAINRLGWHARRNSERAVTESIEAHLHESR
jgi:UDP-glucose 4-epimerase